nr:hypothetical protein [Tanacetum cinerariifolium]
MQVAQVMDLVLNQMSMMSNNARSLGDSGEKDDDDEDETEDDEGNDDGDNSDGNDDDDDNDGNEYGDSDHERIESDRYENPNLNQSSEEHKEEEEENVDEFTDKEDDDDNAKEENKEELDDAEELYKDVKVNLRKENVKKTDADQAIVDRYIDNKQGEAIQQAIKSHAAEFLEFATHVIEQNVVESLEAAVLAKSSSQPKSTYEAAASLS